MDTRHGEQFIALMLYQPPEPPFYLLHLALDSDRLLGNTRLTRDLRRMHIGGVAPAIVNQPLLRAVVDALLQHSEPRKAWRGLEGLHSALSRGPAAGGERWVKAEDALQEILTVAPSLATHFPADAPWPIRPGDAMWAWAEKVLYAKLKEVS